MIRMYFKKQDYLIYFIKLWEDKKDFISVNGIIKEFKNSCVLVTDIQENKWMN